MLTIAELLEVARAIRAAPDTPATRRILERLDRDEIDVRQAIDELLRCSRCSRAR